MTERNRVIAKAGTAEISLSARAAPDLQETARSGILTSPVFDLAERLLSGWDLRDIRKMYDGGGDAAEFALTLAEDLHRYAREKGLVADVPGMEEAFATQDELDSPRQKIGIG